MAYPIVDELSGGWISVQGHLQPADSPKYSSLFSPTDDLMYYEVIRVVRGIPLFWEDHIERLQKSVRGTLTIPESLFAESLNLIAANKAVHANLRLVMTAGLRVLYLMPSYYPTPELIREGVPTGLLQWERENPNTKIVNSDYKDAVAARFAHPGPFGRYFELLLADRDGYLTEGSRSNLFFIKGGQVISAPDDRILKGITRKYVRQAIAAAGSTLADGMLTFAEIRDGACDAAFLTGSPIDLLPIRSVEDILLASAVNPLLQKIHKAYQKLVEQYISERSTQINQQNLPDQAI